MSLILLAPSWATMVNGIMTVSGAWQKLKTDPALKFIVLSLAFYGLATFEGPMMSTRNINVVSHFTDWTIGHVHSGALGWNAMITYGTFYYLVPRLVGVPLYSIPMANTHFWLALSGTMLYIVSMWAAGVLQGLLWLSVDSVGELSYGFRDIMSSMAPYYALRLLAGLIFLTGTLMMAYNFYMTVRGRKDGEGLRARC
jgi:cytochrome c oxidase cbb3-type subunit 1